MGDIGCNIDGIGDTESNKALFAQVRHWGSAAPRWHPAPSELQSEDCFEASSVSQNTNQRFFSVSVLSVYKCSKRLTIDIVQTVLKLIHSGYQYNQEISRRSLTCIDRITVMQFNSSPRYIWQTT